MAVQSLTIEIFAALWALLCLLAGAVVTDTLLRDAGKVVNRQG